jgi:hypothetical protein
MERFEPGTGSRSETPGGAIKNSLFMVAFGVGERVGDWAIAVGVFVAVAGTGPVVGLPLQPIPIRDRPVTAITPITTNKAS